MALGSNQPLTEVSTRNIAWGKAGGGKGGLCVGLTTSLYACVDGLEIWELQALGSRRTSLCAGLKKLTSVDYHELWNLNVWGPSSMYRHCLTFALNWKSTKVHVLTL
jgi:hypothetical protein